MGLAAFLLTYFFLALKWWGSFDNLEQVRVVRMHLVKPTLQGDALKRLQASQWAILKFTKGDRLQTFIDNNRKIAKAWGPGGLARASPVRAVPVLVDQMATESKYWALENDG